MKETPTDSSGTKCEHIREAYRQHYGDDAAR